MKLDDLLRSNFASEIEWKVQNDFRVLLFQTFVSEVVQVKNELKSFKAEVFWVMVKYVQYSGQKIGGTETYMKNDFPNGYNACQYFHSFPKC